MRSVLFLVLLAVLAAAQYYAYRPYSDNVALQHGFRGVAVVLSPIGLAEGSNNGVEEVVGPRQYVRTVHYGVYPGMMTSPWFPDGTPLEYAYTRATALLEVEEVDPRRDVKWYVYSIHHTDVWELLPAAVLYGLHVAVKSDERPVLDCLTHVKDAKEGRVYNATCPGNTSTIYNVYVYYRVTYTGARELCVSIYYFRQDVWWRYGGWGYGYVVLSDCTPRDKPPRNITIAVVPVGAASRLDIYVDGERLSLPPPKHYKAVFNATSGIFEYVADPTIELGWKNGILYINTSKARLYTGPYLLSNFAAAEAFVRLNYPGVVLKPLGSAFLLIGNETAMAPPRYVIKATGWGPTQARVELTYDGGVAVLPGRTYDNSTVYAWPLVEVKINGRPAQLPYRALLNASKICPHGWTASGQYRQVGGWVEIRGPVSIHCTRYPVTFVTPAGNHTVIADYNTTVTWTPPAVDFGNGTRAEADPVAVFVDGPKTVIVNYSRVYYRVRIDTPLGPRELWAPRGSELRLPDVYDFGNGTRLVLGAVLADGGPAPAKVEGPLVIWLKYKRQHLVRLVAPVNATETWVDEGGVFRVELADPWELGNGTLFRTLLINGTAAREWRVEKPLTLVAQYAEAYYWVEVDAPVNATRGWAARGAVLRFPAVVDFGNGTRLVLAGPDAVAVDKPLKLEVKYTKQYYVRIDGVVRWEGWTDEGVVVRLNATAAGGVAYTPLEAVTATAPGVYRPLFRAEYKTAVRDVFGVPNPLAAVKLCGAAERPAPDGSVYITAETRELCTPEVETFPISPYTATAAAAIAATALLKRRK